MAPTEDSRIVDAQGRGRADDIDPADQWVLNPQTGEYELRLSPPGPSPVPGPRRAAADPGGHAAAGAARTATRTAPAEAPPAEPEVPGPRRRRGAPQEPPPGRRSRRPAKKASRGKRIAVWTGGVMAFLLVGTAGAGYWYLKKLEGNVTTEDVGAVADSGFAKNEAFNILIIGTDKRTGKGNEGYGDKGSPGHADTNILLHVAKDRSNATAMSIPRDLIVDIPECEATGEDGTTKVIPGTPNTRFNVSLGQSGRNPGCTMKTVEELTGIDVNHFVMADFNAVKTLTSAVGGVEVCLAKPVDDKDSHLKLPAGKSVVEGEQALAFVRTRKSFGNSGDLDRIKAQQQFLASLMRKMTSSDTLTSPTKLIKLANAATKALTVDKGIGDANTLKDLALELKKVPVKNITFMTLPVVDNPNEVVKATVVVDQTRAPDIFEMIRNDESFTEVKAQEKKEKAEIAARLKGPKSDPSEVRVRILNGGAPAGSAQAELTYLQTKEGVTKSENAGNAEQEQARTTLEYDPEQADQARRLADILGLKGAQMKPGESVTNSQGLPTMTLILGKDFKGAGVKLNAPKKVDVDKSTADEVKCAS